MKTSKTTIVYFSPTGGTERVARLVGRNLDAGADEIDITVKGEGRLFAQDELVIFCVPVYGGRVPPVAISRVKELRGEETPAVVAAVFGNGSYGDALLELSDTVKACGFAVAGAAVFIAPHSVAPVVAAARPDASDRECIRGFAEKVRSKLEAAGNAADIPSLSVPGKSVYKQFGGVPISPRTGKNCTNCGLCAASCPAGAISAAAPQKTDKSKCILCMRCISVCPENARSLPHMVRLLANAVLPKIFKTRREPETFI
ncbi:MAG: 4Fe-4S dicluster domain-containing protein [Clostridia bacterium]|nr:4Fe-4S dicluster domain-containing protein [Clostridia bacterium]